MYFGAIILENTVPVITTGTAQKNERAFMKKTHDAKLPYI